MSFDALLEDLGSADWSVVCDAVDRAQRWLRTANFSDARIATLVDRLVALGSHPKWEVRRAVASASAHTRHPRFDPVLDALRADGNRMVRQAAGRAVGRRQRWAATHAFAKERSGQVDAVLDDIEARYGTRGRDAVKRAAEKMLSIFTRELYHEVVKLLSSIATSAERLGDLVAAGQSSVLHDEVRRLEQRVEHVQAVLAAMRTYAAQPRLEFADEDVGSIVAEAVGLVRDRERPSRCPGIEVDACDGVRAEVVRARLLQALTCILDNAVEAYEAAHVTEPIQVGVREDDTRITIRVQDFGVGMSAEGISDARSLFVTTKPGGTGFGLPLAITIVESELDGTLTIESARGEGTTVEIVVPRRRFGVTS